MVLHIKLLTCFGIALCDLQTFNHVTLWEPCEVGTVPNS